MSNQNNSYKDFENIQTLFFNSKISSNISNKEWMNEVENKLISTINIPGTHDSFALNGGYMIYKCQSLDLISQLISGIRYFDLRCVLENNIIEIYHMDYKQNINLDNILEIINDFLIQHPSEFIIVRIKEEIKLDRNIDIKSIILNILLKYKDIIYVNTNSQIPFLNEVRGKLIVLDDKLNLSIGYKWEDMIIQDDYLITEMKYIENKLNSINNHFIKNSKSKIENAFIINHLSSSCVPKFYIDVSPCSSSFTSNRFLYDILIEKQKEFCTFGIMPIDFPGDDLITKIIESNYI